MSAALVDSQRILPTHWTCLHCNATFTISDGHEHLAAAHRGVPCCVLEHMLLRAVIERHPAVSFRGFQAARPEQPTARRVYS